MSLKQLENCVLNKSDIYVRNSDIFGAITIDFVVWNISFVFHITQHITLFKYGGE